MQKKKLAIIGSGISGLSCAYHLANDFDVTVFEQADYLGGHTDTHTFTIDGKATQIDSGFIIFCPEFYPHFNAMLEKLDVEKQPTDMSFSVHNKRSGLLYNATNLNKLFCQRANLLKPSFYRMLFDIIRFYSRAPKSMEHISASLTTGEYLRQYQYSASFTNDHLVPMMSALWSTTPTDVLKFPIRHLIDFFANHGLLKLFRRPQWYVVKNGSRSYVDVLHDKLGVHWKINSPVAAVHRNDHVVVETADLQQHIFDGVVFATHADQALKLLRNPTAAETDILGAFEFEDNHVLVHTDDTIMPENRLAWASWNTQVPSSKTSAELQVCTANYWMNSLQSLALETQVFTTLNGEEKIDPQKILAERFYSHPVFTPESVVAQSQKHRLDGVNHSYFVGAYWGWGFHEDGARSAADVSKLIKEQLA